MAISHGATSSVDATTEPRPRLTKTIGSVQQTSVVTDEARPTTLVTLSRIQLSSMVANGM
jgi:hypothetical protein